MQGLTGLTNVFNDMDQLEPKCPGCGVVLDYGTNTEYTDEHGAHVCLGCGTVLK